MRYDIVAFLLISLIAFTVIIYAYRSYNKVKTLQKNLVSLAYEKYALEELIIKQSQQIPELQLDQSDGFIKFLSDSRDAAHEFIDAAQSSMRDFDIIMIRELSKDSLNSKDIETLSLAYANLKQSILPENNQTPND